MLARPCGNRQRTLAPILDASSPAPLGAVTQSACRAFDAHVNALDVPGLILSLQKAYSTPSAAYCKRGRPCTARASQRHQSLIHLLGSWALQHEATTAPADCLKVGCTRNWSRFNTVMRQVALPIATSGFHQYGSFLHGAVWHAIVATTGGWSDALALCNFTQPLEWAVTSISCIHGIGHAFLMLAAPASLITNYSACNQPGWGLHSLPNGTLEAALDECRAGPSPAFAVVCAEGVWEAFVQIGPVDGTLFAERMQRREAPWYSVCTLVESLNAPCFMTAWDQMRGGWRILPQRPGHPSDCVLKGLPEHQVRACISGISRWLFYRSTTRGIRLVHLPDGSGLVKFCSRTFLLYEHLKRIEDRDQARMLSCVAGSMYGIVFGPARVAGITGGQLTLLCSGLLREWLAKGVTDQPRRHEAYELCARFKSSIMPLEEALSVLPTWYSDHRLLG